MEFGVARMMKDFNVLSSPSAGVFAAQRILELREFFVGISLAQANNSSLVGVGFWKHAKDKDMRLPKFLIHCQLPLGRCKLPKKLCPFLSLSHIFRMRDPSLVPVQIAKLGRKEYGSNNPNALYDFA